MRDWKSEVHERLQALAIAPERQAEIVDELAQHLRDRYEELRADGHSPEAAEAMLLDELDRGQLRDQLRRTEASYTPPVALGSSGGIGAAALLQHLRYA